ncbi:ATP-binding protein [Pseudomonas syringae]|nr:ATP-binding protein [Pseudomonas syringae]
MNLNFEFEEESDVSAEHPALSTLFRLHTPVLKDVVKQAFFKVSMKQTGLIFYGPPRVGKTRCFKALRVEIPKRFPNTYVVSMIAVSRENARHISTIVNQLILKEGIDVSRYDSSIKVFNILVDRIVGRMRQQRKNHLVLLFDELQRFAAADFFQLADMVNEMDDKGIKVTVISFGMPELVEIVQGFKDVTQLQIISRFMSNLLPVAGVTNKASLELIFGLYDAEMYYPKGSGVSYTQHFFPKSFALGWRLASLANSVWNEMHKVASGNYVSNLPMEHVATIVRYFHVISPMADGSAFPISESDVVDAVNVSDFNKFCVAVEKGLVT